MSTLIATLQNSSHSIPFYRVPQCDYPQITLENQYKSVNHAAKVDACVRTAWLELIASDVDEGYGDDWLYLCGDIDEGEIYQDWFIWHDTEVTGNWEAYDPITNERFVHYNLTDLKTLIDDIEQSRNVA